MDSAIPTWALLSIWWQKCTHFSEEFVTLFSLLYWVWSTKIDQSFPGSQFFINRFSKPFKKDINRHNDGLLVYIKEDIPQKEWSFNLPSDIKIIIFELYISKIKWLVCGCYHPPSQSDEFFFYHLGKVLDNFSTKYYRFFLLGDFNVQENETILSEFSNVYNAKNAKNKTCFKIIENPLCVDLVITDKPGRFQLPNFLKQVYWITINLSQQLWKQNLQVCSLPRLQKF